MLEDDVGELVDPVAENEELTAVLAVLVGVMEVSDQDRIEAHAAPEPVESPVESEDEIHRRLYEAISRLSAGWGEMLILRYVHKSSDAEIARLLGKSRGTVAVTLYRARARLKKWMSDSLGGKS